MSDWAIDLVLILNDVSYSWVIGNAALVTAWPSDSNRISDKRSFEYAPILIAVNWILRGCSSSSVTGGGRGPRHLWSAGGSRWATVDIGDSSDSHLNISVRDR